MTRLSTFFACALLLPTLGGCARDIFATHNTPQDLQQAEQKAASPKSDAPVAAAATPAQLSATNCTSLANKRLGMLDRPDTYPISDQQKHDAYQALYSACMNGENQQAAAGPAHSVPSPEYRLADANSYANLSPAAGGANAYGAAAGGAIVSSNGIPGATVLVINPSATGAAPQLSSLSPASGGANAAAPTVIYVQAAPAPAPQQPRPAAYQPAYRPAAYTPANTPLPVAIPVPPPAAAASNASVFGQPVPPRATMAANAPAGNGTQQLQTVLEH